MGCNIILFFVYDFVSPSIGYQRMMSRNYRDADREKKKETLRNFLSFLPLKINLLQPVMNTNFLNGYTLEVNLYGDLLGNELGICYYSYE